MGDEVFLLTGAQLGIILGLSKHLLPDIFASTELIAAADRFIARYDYLHGDRPQVMKLEMDEFRDAVAAAKK